MQTISRIKVIVFVLLLLPWHAAHAEQAAKAPFLVLLSEKTKIIFTRSGSKIKAESQPDRKKRPVDKKLSVHLLAADEVHFLFMVPSSDANTELFVVLSREPSNPKNPMGNCGAGYEDLLLLVEVMKNEITLIDKFKIQSCLEVISLKTDQEDDPLKIIAIDKEKKFIHFEWLEEAEGNIRTIFVEDRHFVMQTKK